MGEANGNGTKAAITAGYSEATAGQAASRLLKREDVREAIGLKLEKADIRTDAILKRLGKIVHTEPESVRAADIVSASKVILQVNGALQPKQQDSRITVNIGFLTHPHSADPTALSISTVDGECITTPVVMAQQPQVSRPGECGVLDGGVKD